MASSKSLRVFGELARANEEKKAQETMAFRKSGDFFRKIVVLAGSRRAMVDENGIVYVGVIPFLLDPALLEG